MNRPVWIFAAVLALAGGILGLALIEEPLNLRGAPHPDIPGARQGGDGAARHLPILLPGWLFGCTVILCLSALVRFGGLRGPGRQGLSRLMHTVTVLYLGTWSWLVWAYRASLDDTAPQLFLSLPHPTAIMIFAFWPVSMLFSALFVIGFGRWVLTGEEEAAFRRLVDARRPDAP